MKKLLTTAALATAMTVSAAAFAEGKKTSGFSNTWVDVEYVDNDWDGGLRARGSFGLGGGLNVIGSMSFYDNVNALTGGVSYALPLGNQNNLDLLLHGELAYYDYDYGGSDTEVIFGSELRFQVIDPLELYGDLYYTTAGNGDLGLDLGARFSVTDSIQVIGGIDIGGNDTLHIGGRFNF